MIRALVFVVVSWSLRFESPWMQTIHWGQSADEIRVLPNPCGGGALHESEVPGQTCPKSLIFSDMHANLGHLKLCRVIGIRYSRATSKDEEAPINGIGFLCDLEIWSDDHVWISCCGDGKEEKERSRAGLRICKAMFCCSRSNACLPCIYLYAACGVELC